MTQSTTNTSRRDFLKHSGTAACLSAAAWTSLVRGESPNDRIRVGVIGTGVRGKYLIGNLPDSARVTAICDCATSRMAETLAPTKQFAEILAGFGETQAAHCSKHQDYRQMLDRQQLDAVIIATPDHHHVQAAMLALDARLDVYLEKPLTVTIREGRLLADKVKQTGRVLQVGSQQRTMEINRFACEFIRDGGLGKISKVELPNYPGPMSTAAFPAEAIPKGLDWNLFLGPTAARPHNRKLWMKDDFKVGNLMWRGWDLSPTRTLSESKTTHEVEFALLDEFTARFEVVAHQDSKGKIENQFEELRIQPLCLVGPAFMSQDPTFMSPTNTLSKTKTTHEVEFMLLDELATGFDMIAHQDSKSLIRCKMSPRAFQTLCLADSRFVSQISTFVSPTM